MKYENMYLMYLISYLLPTENTVPKCQTAVVDFSLGV